MKKFTHICLAMILFALMSIAPAYAHTDLVHSSPASNEHLDAAPEQLELTFGDPVRLMRLNLTDSDGDRVRLEFRPSRDAAADYRIDLPDLEDGHYELEWRAVAEDGHTMTGSFSFHIGENGEAHEQHRESPSDHQHHH